MKPEDTFAEILGRGTEYEAILVLAMAYDGVWRGHLRFMDEMLSRKLNNTDYFGYLTSEAETGTKAQINGYKEWKELCTVFDNLKSKKDA